MTPLNLDYNTGAAYYGDCVDIMTAWKNQGVQGIIDLIYLDPPFNSNRNYGAPTSKSKKNDSGSLDAFTDMWTYNMKAHERVERIIKEQKLHPAHLLIKSLFPYLKENDPGMLAYLSYMADRLRLLKGLLKETGSIYLHCDPFANYYLRLLMDSIFGPENFRNEIVWWYYNGSSSSKRLFGCKHDTILRYSKSDKWTFNPDAVRIPYEPTSGWLKGKNKDSYGNPNPKGKIPHDVFQIPSINNMAKEREGYPTQKPLKLLDRIIQASTNEGDIVLDPFAGCGTTMHSAVKNKRRFIGMDISVFTIYEVARKRLKRECGLDVPIYGIPTNFAGAKLLANKDKRKFEDWAAESLTFGNIGIISNKIKSHDRGIDGSGLLYGYTEDGKDKVIVQVKGGGFTISDVRAFKDRIRSFPEVAAGIFITLDGDNPKSKHRWTKGMEAEAMDLGTFQMPNGDKTFRRMQHWSVRDRFKGKDGKGVYPEMPIMINPFNEKPMIEIGDTIPNKPLPMARQPAKRGRRNGKTKPDLF